MMPWLRLTFRLPQADVDGYSETLESFGAVAVTLTSADGQPQFETEWDKTPLWADVELAALFPPAADVPAILAQASRQLGTSVPTYQLDTLADENWATAWKADYRPIHIAERLWVCPSWCEAPAPDAINIILDPGMAFGTGTHPTTSMCLAWLARQDLAGKTVLDVGCGSGILAIAALKLGARRAIAIDTDPQALVVTRENAERNGVTANLTIALPNEIPAHQTADVLVANILAGALIELAPHFKTRLAAGGAIALSGVLATQAAEVAASYAPWVSLETQAEAEWTLLRGKRAP